MSDTEGDEGQTAAVIEEGLRAAAVPPFHAMAMARAASDREADGHRVLHLEVGQPATGLPAAARDAVTASLDRPLGYTNARGIDPLRHRLAERHGVDVDRIAVVSGASAGFTLAFLTLFDAGARVGVLEPGYPCYRNTLIALGMEPVAIPVGPGTRFAPSSELLAAAGPLDGLIIASPSNPTGTILDADALDTISTYCTTNDVKLVADEIYHGISADPAPQILDHHPEAFVINSFSKYYSMTGWRVGWIVVPESVADAVERLQQNLFICAPHVSQVAALAALDATDELDAHVERYLCNRDLIVPGLAAAGIDRIAPADGAFYVYAHVPELTTELGIDSLELCRRWLDELGLCATPGIDFDIARGHEYVRFSYAGPTDVVGEAVDLLGGWQP